MKENEKKVLFDPGYASIVTEALGQVGYTYYTFCAVSNYKAKKLNFVHTLRKLEKYLKINVAFYLGCMMWASYITKFKDYEIEGNKLLGEECSEEEYTGEINFLIDFVKNQLPKDSKYYTGKPWQAPEGYLEILEAYKEFLLLNKGFVNCTLTNQIILPKAVKKLSEDELDIIYKKIQTAIDAKKAELLFDDWKMLF